MKIEMRPIPEVEGVLLAEPFKGTSEVHVERHDCQPKKERFIAVVLDMPQIPGEYCGAYGNTPNWALQQAINKAQQYIKKLEGIVAIAKGNILLAESIMEAEFVEKEQE